MSKEQKLANEEQKLTSVLVSIIYICYNDFHYLQSKEGCFLSYIVHDTIKYGGSLKQEVFLTIPFNSIKPQHFSL